MGQSGSTAEVRLARVPSSQGCRAPDADSALSPSLLPSPPPAHPVAPEFHLGAAWTPINSRQWKMELGVWMSWEINYIKCSRDKRNSCGLAWVWITVSQHSFLSWKVRADWVEYVLCSDMITHSKLVVVMHRVPVNPDDMGHQKWSECAVYTQLGV